MYVNGAVYIDGEHAGISWVPSVGWPININNEDASKPTPWRSVTIYATEDSDGDGEPIKITHEVSDEEFNCPPSLHGIAPVTVRIIDSGDGGGDGNGDGGGDGNGDGGGGGGGGDDDPPGLSIDDAPAVREGETAEFVVRLSAASGAAVTVAYETLDGTAVAGVDYTSTSGTLRFDAGETRTTLAVPTLEDATAEETEGFTVQLSEPSGATVADGTATGTITDEAQRRIEVVNDVVLPEVGRALAFSAVRCRIDQMLSGSVPRGTSTELSAHLALSPEARSGQWAAPGVQSPTLVQAFDDSLFLMQSQEEEDGEGRFAAWWCADYQNLGGGGRGGGITWDGAVSSWHAGADARIGPGLRAGVSFSRSRGSFDYRGGGRNLDAGRSTYALGLVSIHPYLAWSVLPDLDVWGTVGHAWGDLRVVDAAAGNVLTSPATLDSGVVGVSGRLLTRGATTVRLKGEWALAQMHVARASTAFDAAPVDMQRLRMGAEVSYQHTLSSGASLIPWDEVGLRHDGGDGESGAGLELGGGLRHRNPGGRPDRRGPRPRGS